MKVALDTNILVYAEGLHGAERRSLCRAVLAALPSNALCIPVQVLGELFTVLVRKGGRSRSDARSALLGWRSAFSALPTSSEVLVAAADLATDHQFSLWDAIVLSSSAQAGCRLLLSEDLQHGFTWGGVTVVNPFHDPRHPLLDALLA